MPPKKEICSFFQRGNCKFGDRCKYLHTTSQGQQQSRTSPFDVGRLSETTPFQKTNPFGFGVQNDNQNRAGGGANFAGSKPGQFKPFENKWSRSSTNTRQSESQSALPADHKCTDPELCKRVIVEDQNNEKPQWKLTCYAHNRSGPCDIVGDISSEELRALAYNDAALGKSMQFIVDRERSLIDSKLAEFQQLVQRPFTGSSKAALSTQSSFGVSPPVSGFSQFGASLNTGLAATPSYTFGQSSPFQNHSQPFQMKNSSFSGPGPNSSTLSAQKNPFSTFTNSSLVGNAPNNQLNFGSNLPSSSGSSAFAQSSMSTQLTSNLPKEINNDGTIWSKAEWKIGEIPEESPPDIYIY